MSTRHHALFFNGVFESVLTEIIDALSSGKISIAYLQPYSTGVIKFLKEKKPSPESPIIGYYSTTRGLSEVSYVAEIIGWEDKRTLSDLRKAEVDSKIKAFQPGEKELYFINDKDGKYANLITVRNVRRLNRSIPVTNLTKVSDGKPHRIRNQAGGWSTVLSLPSEYDEMVSYTELQVKEKLARGLKESNESSSEIRRIRLNAAERQPQRIQIVSTGYNRNPDVIAEVLLRADGNCEKCGNPAPFIRISNGTPYLEVHHTQYLADGGDDTVENAQALCPNCHREMHFGKM